MKVLQEFFQEAGRDSVASGLTLGITLHLVCGLGALLLLDNAGSPLTVTAVVYCGLAQLAYMLPALFIAHTMGRRETKYGIVIIAAITLALNAGCWCIALLEKLL